MKRMARASESAWPTPQVSDENGAADPNREDHRVQLRDVETGLGSTSPQPAPDQSNTGGNPPESWPTATVGDSANAANETAKRKNEDSKHHEGTTLVDAMRNWATPQASDHVEGARTAPESNQKCLGRDLAKQENWFTPTTTDIVRTPEGVRKRVEYRKSIGRKYVEGCLSEQVDNKSLTGDMAKQEQGSAWPTPRTQMVRGAKVNRNKCNLEEEVAHPSLKLSSRWVETLMGLPIGWTDPTCSRPITPWEAVYTAASMNSEPSETE